MNDSDIESSLSKSKPRGLSEQEKIVLWAHINSELDGKHAKHFSHAPMLSSWMTYIHRTSKKAVALAAIVFVLLGGTTATVAAASTAKPGDLLYPINIATENVRIALAPSTNAKDDLRVAFAQKRYQEVADLFSAAGVASSSSESASSTAPAQEPEATMRPMVAAPLVHTLAVSAPHAATDTATTSNSQNTSDTTNAPITYQDERAVYGLQVALQNLAQARKDVAASGDTQALAHIDQTIANLTALASKHIAGAEQLKQQIVDQDNTNVTVHIKDATRKNGKITLDLQIEQRDQAHTNNASSTTAPNQNDTASPAQTQSAATSSNARPTLSPTPSVPPSLRSDDGNGEHQEGTGDHGSYEQEDGAQAIGAFATSTSVATTTPTHTEGEFHRDRHREDDSE